MKPISEIKEDLRELWPALVTILLLIRTVFKFAEVRRNQLLMARREAQSLAESQSVPRWYRRVNQSEDFADVTPVAVEFATTRKKVKSNLRQLPTEKPDTDRPVNDEEFTPDAATAIPRSTIHVEPVSYLDTRKNTTSVASVSLFPVVERKVERPREPRQTANQLKTAEVQSAIAKRNASKTARLGR